jgi:hypothetical protein
MRPRALAAVVLGSLFSHWSGGARASDLALTIYTDDTALVQDTREMEVSGGHVPDGPIHPDVVLRFQNSRREGLGEPLPQGYVRVLQERGDESPVLLGETAIDRHTPRDHPVRLVTGQALHVNDHVTVSDLRIERLDEYSERLRARVEHVIRNDHGRAVTVEVRQVGRYDDPVKISRSSHRWTREDGQPLWRLRVPPASAVVLRYRVDLQR